MKNWITNGILAGALLWIWYLIFADFLEFNDSEEMVTIAANRPVLAADQQRFPDSLYQVNPFSIPHTRSVTPIINPPQQTQPVSVVFPSLTFHGTIKPTSKSTPLFSLSDSSGTSFLIGIGDQLPSGWKLTRRLPDGLEFRKGSQVRIVREFTD